eukprot:9482778-Heterocapsa_arctica.AAC.1
MAVEHHHEANRRTHDVFEARRQFEAARLVAATKWPPPRREWEVGAEAAQVQSEVELQREPDKEVQLQREPDSGGSFATAHGSWAA